MEASGEQEATLDNLNNIGDVPRAWYREQRHVGYSQDGYKLIPGRESDRLDQLLRSIDDSSSWRRQYDVQRGYSLQLSSREIEMIQRINFGRLPTSVERSDLAARHVARGDPALTQEPKRRFLPSRHEARKVISMVRRLRRRIDTPTVAKDKRVYRLFDIWDGNEMSENAIKHAPKPKRAGNELSYNAPAEYGLASTSSRGPSGVKSLRQLMTNIHFIKERFNRCLDLYLCPRVERQVVHTSPDSILPEIPQLATLKPFPSVSSLRYSHGKEVLCISIDDTGELLCSGGSTGELRFWEVNSGRCLYIMHFSEPVICASWRPGSQQELVVCSGQDIFIISAVNDFMMTERCVAPCMPMLWSRRSYGLVVRMSGTPSSINWHRKGDYFASTERESGTLCVHQLSTRNSQVVFSSAQHRVVQASFHPRNPIIFTATRTHIRVFDVREQKMVHRLKAGNSSITTFAVDDSGQNVIVCCADSRIQFYNFASLTTPIKVLKLQAGAGLAISFHRELPLFAVTISTGGTQLFHFTMSSDLMASLTVIPLKLLDAHVQAVLGTPTCKFHPTQPWIFCTNNQHVCLYTE